MEKRAIDHWLDEKKREEEQRAPKPRQQEQVPEIDVSRRSLHFQEFEQQMREDNRARHEFKAALQAEFVAAVDQGTRDRVKGAQQALRAAQEQLQQAEEALESHSAEVPPVNASGAWVQKFAARKSQLQNELSAYEDIARRASQGYQDAVNAFNNQVVQLAQQRLWQAEQNVQTVTRQKQAEVDASFANHQRTLEEANRAIDQARGELNHLRNALT